MRCGVERNQRGTLMKDRYSAGLGLLKSTACTKHVKGGFEMNRVQGRIWRQYFKAVVLALSVAFLFLVIVRPDLMTLHPEGRTVQLLPPVTHRGGLDTDNKAIISASVMDTRAIMTLTEENFPMPRPRVGAKEVLLHTSAAPQNVSSRNGFANPLGLSKDIKIYIYDLPSSFNVAWLKDDRCSKHLFAAEVAFHQRLLSSPVRTLEPREADYFFVPVYVSCNFNTSTGLPSLGHARSLLGSAVRHVARKMPYWNRTKGEDHICVATHDYGPCFHTMEDMAATAGIPGFLRNSVILQTFGQIGKHACQSKNSITIPPYVAPQILKKNFSPELQPRDIWVYFRGKIELHPKIVNGRVYSRGIRSILWQKFRRNQSFVIKRTRSPYYHQEIRRSVFCLCPLGWAPWSPRIVESVIFGCIPVIIADKIALPYSHIVKWAKISVTVSEKDINKLGEILENISRTNLSLIQENLWDFKYRKALMYLDPLTVGDASWQILDLLSHKVRPRKIALLNATTHSTSFV